MNENEKAVIVGWWLNGATYLHIATKYGISEDYVKIIIKEWLKGKKESDYQKNPRPKLLPKIPD